MATVREYYNIMPEDEERIIKKIEDIEKGGDKFTKEQIYWIRVKKFIGDIKDLNVEALSKLQRDWLESVLEKIQK